MGYNAGYLGTSPVDSWYEEIKDYSFARSDYIKGTGHFTQVVWKNSKQLGCGVACGSNDYCYVTCNYYPGGNYLGQFRTNVLPLSDSTPEDTTAQQVALQNYVIDNTAKKIELTIPVKKDDSVWLRIAPNTADGGYYARLSNLKVTLVT